MKKLTSELCKDLINDLQSHKMAGFCISSAKEGYLQALEIALPILEQQEVMRVPAYYIVYHPNPDPHEYDDKEHSHCGSIHLAKRLAGEIGGSICPVYIGDKLEQQERGDGWIEWSGGECPVPPGKIVDLKLRKGSITTNYPAGSAQWDHRSEDNDTDIMAYRVVNP